MDLQPYLQDIHHQIAIAAEAGGDDARAVAERLVAPLDAAIRLALQDVLAAAVEEITTELAPGSVELRLRGREPEFVVTLPPIHSSREGLPPGGEEGAGDGWPGDGAVMASAEGEAGAMTRINLRMPDHLKARVEHAAANDGLSVNSWLVRAAAAALERADLPRPRERRAPQGAQRYTGWAR
jgi:hypothetical protein